MKRLEGLDFIRLISMFLVVLVHNLGQGGVLEWTVQNGSRFSFITFYGIENVAIVAVNIFALLTGFLSGKKAIKINRVVDLYFEVLVLSILSLVIYSLFMERTSFSIVLKTFTPVFSGTFWYFNAYIMLTVMSPILAVGMSKISNEKLAIFTFGIVLISTSVGFIRPDFLSNGYSALWLIVLYVVGELIRRNMQLLLLFKTNQLFAVFLLMVALSLGMEFIFPGHAFKFTSYTSPFVFVESMAVFLMFIRIKIRSSMVRKMLESLANVSFGVYIIDSSLPVYSLTLHNSFVPLLTTFSVWQSSLIILLVSMIMFFAFLFLSYLRFVFFKITKLNLLGLKITNFFTQFGKNIYVRIKR